MLTVDTRTYGPERGWSLPLPAALDGPQTLVLAFGASEGPALRGLDDLAARFPRSVHAGCSTAGEIAGRIIADESLSVAICRFDRTRLRQASTTVAGEGSHAAGVALARTLSGPDLRGVLVFSDGLVVNGSDLVRGLGSVLGAEVVVTGGLAADGSRFARTWVYEGRAPRPALVTAIGFYGDAIRIGHGSRGGWDVFGVERIITRSRGNVLYELDGRPALDLYKSYLGDRAEGLPATALLFPLSIRESASDTRSLVRTVLHVSEAAQSMTFAGDMPQGGRARLMRANFERLIDGASQAARFVGTFEEQAPSLTVAISCVGRRLVLGERAEEEVEAACDALPAGAQVVGFYSYGEISPYASGSCDLHNQTMTLTHLQEI